MKYLEESNCNCNLTLSLDEVMTECLFKQNRSSHLYACTYKFSYSFIENSHNECADYCPLECESNKFHMNFNIERYPVTGNITSGKN